MSQQYTCVFVTLCLQNRERRQFTTNCYIHSYSSIDSFCPRAGESSVWPVLDMFTRCLAIFMPRSLQMGNSCHCPPLHWRQFIANCCVLI